MKTIYLFRKIKNLSKNVARGNYNQIRVLFKFQKKKKFSSKNFLDWKNKHKHKLDKHNFFLRK